MHRKLNKPSLIEEEEEDDDKDTSNFGKNSNRFLKSKNLKDQPKDSLQRNQQDRVALNRSITPRSIDTDSDIGYDDHEENDYLSSLKSNDRSSSKNSLGGSGWQPNNNKKSPKTSFLDEQLITDGLNKNLNNSNDIKPKSNFDDKHKELLKSENSEESDYLSSLKHINPPSMKNNSDDFSWQSNNKTKSPRTQFVNDEKKDFQEYTKPKDSQKNYKKFEDNNVNNSFLKTLRFQDTQEVSNMLDSINKKPDLNEKSKKPISKLGLVDDDENDFHEYLKSQNSKSDKLDFNQKTSKSKISFEDDNDDMKPSPSTRFLKSQKPKLSEENDIHPSKFNENSNKFQRKFEIEEDPDNSLKSSSYSKFSDHILDPKFQSNKNNSKFDIVEKKNDSSDLYLSNEKLKHTNVMFDKPQSPELIGTSKFIPNDSKKKSNDYNFQEHELNNSTKHLILNQTIGFGDSNKSEIKPKPRKSYPPKHEEDDLILFSTNKDGSKTDNKDDFKTRSIRFEDETPESFRHRETSPRKSDISKQNSRNITPSPPTSICEELLEDPVEKELKALQKRREEKKRLNESKFQSIEHQIVNDSINEVSDCQKEKDSTKVIISISTPKSRPASAKYKNVQPKISTRINLKSLKSPSMNDEWSSTPNLYNDMDSINSERSFSNAQSVRDTAYLQWYMAKLAEKNSKKAPENGNAEKKKETTDDERIATYEAWKNAKRNHFLELDRKKKEEEKKKEEAKIPIVKDNKSAELAFEIWKKQKEEKDKEESKKKGKEKKKQEMMQMKEKEEKKNKKSELLTDWENKKAKEIQDKKQQLQKDEKLKAENENKIKEKLLEAEKAYRAWEDKAEIKEKKYTEFEKNKEILMNNRRAWRPSTNAIVKTRRT